MKKMTPNIGNRSTQSYRFSFLSTNLSKRWTSNNSASTVSNILHSYSDLLFQDDKQMVVVGVLGKSSQPDCNKMAGFKILNFCPSLISSAPRDGKITFYFKETENLLYVHFESTYDAHILKDLELMQNDSEPMNFHALNSAARTKFAKVWVSYRNWRLDRKIFRFQILLFATQICHIIVLVETGKVFDASYLSMFKALKTIRERYVLKFLPKLLKNTTAGQFMGKDGRLCSPRIIFLFERCLMDYSKLTQFHGNRSSGFYLNFFLEDGDGLQKLEFDIEDRIYKMLRNEFVITNNRYRRRLASNEFWKFNRKHSVFCIQVRSPCFPYRVINDTFMLTMILT